MAHSASTSPDHSSVSAASDRAEGALAAGRLATVLEHMRLENAHDFPGCIGEFGHPRYELVATGELHDGEEGVAGLMEENVTAFPDFHFAVSRAVPAGEAVLVEGRFTGSHLGPWRGLPGTGRKVDVAMAVVFEFEGARMICERVYFDLLTVLRQLGVARDPQSLAGRVMTFLNHPLTVLGALLRSLFTRRNRP
jgi:predicted ester cyclase